MRKSRSSCAGWDNNGLKEPAHQRGGADIVPKKIYYNNIMLRTENRTRCPIMDTLSIVGQCGLSIENFTRGLQEAGSSRFVVPTLAQGPI
jgi:hypothetical protein